MDLSYFLKNNSFENKLLPITIIEKIFIDRFKNNVNIKNI